MEIRNFAIVAHIDHGKSTLADRLLEATGAVSKNSGAQLLDTMELEKERGITIKLNPARMPYELDGVKYQLNLIDTPGHVDFTYEVSRSLAAVEGVLLIVDAGQGIQAQTLAHYNEVKKQNLKIIPVINKIDLPTAEPEKTAESLIALTDCDYADICFLSAKTGVGVDDLLKKIATLIPAPKPSTNGLQALVFDSFFDKYQGVIAYIKVMGGSIKRFDRLALAQGKVDFTTEELGYMQVKRFETGNLEQGEIGYIATGLKDLSKCRVGDTVIVAGSGTSALEGYQTPQPMVFASFFAEAGEEGKLVVALDKLKLSDSSLTYEPIRSKALGYGFSIGFLGLLHLEIIKERLEREFELNIFVTMPTVAYKFENGGHLEPWVDLEIVCKEEYYGAIIDLAARSRANHIKSDYFENGVVAYFEAPLAEIIVNFYDQLKSVTSGYASMDYRFLDYREADLVTVDLLVAGDKIDALSTLVIRSRAEKYGKMIVERLAELIPKHNFAISIQAAIGGPSTNSGSAGAGKIIARADVKPFRKDVTAKLYGGDVTRKNKLLDKQRKGKKKMRQLGKINVPTEVFIELLKK